MRVVLIGATAVAVRTAELLIAQEHEVVIVDRDRERIDALSQKLDCSFLHGDGSRPDILREAGPEQTDVLLCLTDSDQSNIIASLLGRSLGFQRVVTTIHDPEFETICLELGLEDTIVPARTISRSLTDLVTGISAPELSTVIKAEGRFFTFIAGDAEKKTPVSKLKLPAALVSSASTGKESSTSPARIRSSAQETRWFSSRAGSTCRSSRNISRPNIQS
jgi:trk system potassium uptake protein TrkA